MSTVPQSPVSPRPAAPSAGVVTGLRWSAALLGLLALVQAILGHRGFTGGAPIEGHGVVGFLTLAVAVVAAVLAFLATRGATSKGLFMHAAGMAVLALVQVGLGEAGVQLVHVMLGVLFLIGAVALATLAWRKVAPSTV